MQQLPGQDAARGSWPAHLKATMEMTLGRPSTDLAVSMSSSGKEVFSTDRRSALILKDAKWTPTSVCRRIPREHQHSVGHMLLMPLQLRVLGCGDTRGDSKQLLCLCKTTAVTGHCAIPLSLLTRFACTVLLQGLSPVVGSPQSDISPPGQYARPSTIGLP